MIVYTRVMAPGRKFRACIMAFTYLGDQRKMVQLDDCETCFVDWCDRDTQDQNHEQAVHELIMTVGGVSVGYVIDRLTDEETPGERKYLVE